MLAMNPFERLCPNKNGTNHKKHNEDHKKAQKEFFVLFGLVLCLL